MSNSKFRVATVAGCGLCLLILACANESKTDIDPTPEGGAAGEAQGGEGGDAVEDGNGGGTTSASAGGATPPSGGSAGANVAGQGGVSPGNAGGMGASIGNVGGKPVPSATGGQAGGATAPLSTCEAPACDDFEKYSAGTRPGAPWSEFEVSATGGLSVDASRAFSGTRSMKFTMSPGADMVARMRHAGSGVVPGKEVFMRAMMFLEKTITGQGVFHWNLMRTEGNNSIVAGGIMKVAATRTSGRFETLLLQSVHRSVAIVFQEGQGALSAHHRALHCIAGRGV